MNNVEKIHIQQDVQFYTIFHKHQIDPESNVGELDCCVEINQNTKKKCTKQIIAQILKFNIRQMCIPLFYDYLL